MNIEIALNLLNDELKILGETREIIICGCASLNLQKYTDRATQDVDVIIPKIDLILEKASTNVAKLLNTNLDWLNDHAFLVSEILPAGWEDRVELIFSSDFLRVKSISREDLILTKLDALSNRDRDLLDLISMRPSDDELLRASTHLKTLQDTEGYSEWLDRCVQRIKDRRGEANE